MWFGEGKRPGIYNKWADCKAMIAGYKGAKYKSFPTFAEAKKAYNGNYNDYKGQKAVAPLDEIMRKRIGEPNYNSISVDAASSGNPGIMEYQGVDTKTKKPLFKLGPL